MSMNIQVTFADVWEQGAINPAVDLSPPASYKRRR